MTNVFKSYLLLFFISAIFLAGFIAYALAPRASAAGESISISEVAWMGTAASADDEWIELYNAGDSHVDLLGFSVAAADGSPRTVVATSTCINTIIAPKGYFLLERSDDESVPEVSADCIYSGSLENGGEILSIVDLASTTVFSLDASAGWQGGNNTTKETMQWNDSEWITAISTPRAALVDGGTISGTIVNGENGWHVRMYQYPNAPWKDGAEGVAFREALTNNTGAFIFENIPAGRYQVFVEERDGWRTQTHKRYNFLPSTLSNTERAELALTYDATAQMMLGCALKTVPCSSDLHRRLLNYRYFGVKVGEGDIISGLNFTNMAL